MDLALADEILAVRARLRNLEALERGHQDRERCAMASAEAELSLSQAQWRVEAALAASISIRLQHRRAENLFIRLSDEFGDQCYLRSMRSLLGGPLPDFDPPDLKIQLRAANSAMANAEEAWRSSEDAMATALRRLDCLMGLAAGVKDEDIREAGAAEGSEVLPVSAAGTMDLDTAAPAEAPAEPSRGRSRSRPAGSRVPKQRARVRITEQMKQESGFYKNLLAAPRTT
jgi:hypothetical protein